MSSKASGRSTGPSTRMMRQRLLARSAQVPASAMTREQQRAHCDALYSGSVVHSLARNLTARFPDQTSGTQLPERSFPTSVTLTSQDQEMLETQLGDHLFHFASRLNQALEHYGSPLRAEEPSLDTPRDEVHRQAGDREIHVRLVPAPVTPDHFVRS